MEVFLFFYLVVWSMAGAVVGALIGKSKGRAGAGFVLGLLLGWIGWIIIALMSRSAEAEARYYVAVDAHTRRLTGGPHEHTASQRSKGVTAGVLEAIRTAAYSDHDSNVLIQAIDRYGDAKHPQRRPSEWFFATCPFPFLVRMDGQLLACNSTDVRLVRANAPASYTVSRDGDIVSASIDGLPFQSLRPRPNSIRILEMLRAVAVVAPQSESAAPSTQQSPSPSATNPAVGAPSEAIRTLQTLLEENLVSRDEFERKRQEILDRI